MHETSNKTFAGPRNFRRLRLLAGVAVFTMTLITVLSHQAHADWMGQIVDKQTGKPLAEVVVLAVWRKCSFIVMNGCVQYYDSQEVVTGNAGKFVIQPRRYFGIIPPLPTLKGPDFYIFKPGYGEWSFQGQETWSKDPIERGVQQKETWRQFETEKGVIIELPQLKTREDRYKFYGSFRFPSPPGNVPRENMKRYLEAVKNERAYFGLTP